MSCLEGAETVFAGVGSNGRLLVNTTSKCFSTQECLRKFCLLANKADWIQFSVDLPQVPPTAPANYVTQDQFLYLFVILAVWSLLLFFMSICLVCWWVNRKPKPVQNDLELILDDFPKSPHEKDV
jgi:hypothetical protein